MADEMQENEKVETAVKNVAEDSAQPEEAQDEKKRERRSKQARAAKQEREAAFAAPVEEKKGLAALSVGAWLGISAACLAIGLCLGRFVLGGGIGGAGASSISGVTAVSEDHLDDVFATYFHNGQKGELTVRQVMDLVGGTESMKNEEGNYTLPTAEYAISVARNVILLKEAESRGIKVTDEDMAAYAKKNFSTDDFDALSTNYGIDVDTVKKIIKEDCILNALREEVMGEELPEQPEAPTAPEEGKEAEANKDYADYIIKLAGDEWNAKKGKWADKDGDYATALKDAEFSADGATYEAATSAYYVAYQKFSEKQSELNTKWMDYSNELMSNASVEVNTLVQ